MSPQQFGYMPPQQFGYRPPPQFGYRPPQQFGYKPPQQYGYKPPQQFGYKPPQPQQQFGYKPPQQFGYKPPQQFGYKTPQSQQPTNDVSMRTAQPKMQQNFQLNELTLTNDEDSFPSYGDHYKYDNDSSNDINYGYNVDINQTENSNSNVSYHKSVPLNDIETPIPDFQKPASENKQEVIELNCDPNLKLPYIYLEEIDAKMMIDTGSMRSFLSPRKAHESQPVTQPASQLGEGMWDSPAERRQEYPLKPRVALLRASPGDWVTRTPKQSTATQPATSAEANPPPRGNPTGDNAIPRTSPASHLSPRPLCPLLVRETRVETSTLPGH
ncbi:uncharacterized protein [Maniola hyperantus]|uniref:uncharacterized protein n=1 Tax=Aphantopus hyperantus TaxID=2795564 RepID=UPI003749CD44